MDFPDHPPRRRAWLKTHSNPAHSPQHIAEASHETVGLQAAAIPSCQHISCLYTPISHLPSWTSPPIYCLSAFVFLSADINSHPTQKELEKLRAQCWSASSISSINGALPSYIKSATSSSAVLRPRTHDYLPRVMARFVGAGTPTVQHVEVSPSHSM